MTAVAATTTVIEVLLIFKLIYVGIVNDFFQ